MKLFPAICWKGWQGRTRIETYKFGLTFTMEKITNHNYNITMVSAHWQNLLDTELYRSIFVWQKELRNDFSTEFDLKQQYYHFHYPAWILYTWTCLCLRRVSYLFERVPNFAAASALMRASSDLNFLSSNMLQSNTAIAQQCIYLPDNSKNLKK